MVDTYLKSILDTVQEAKKTKGSNDLERIISEQQLKIDQKQNGQLQIRIKELETQIEDKRVDDGGWINKDND